MDDKPERQKLAFSALANKVFGIVMVVLYVIIGTTIIFGGDLMRNIPRPYAIIFGVFLIAYGLYRGYKYYQKYF